MLEGVTLRGGRFCEVGLVGVSFMLDTQSTARTRVIISLRRIASQISTHRVVSERKDPPSDALVGGKERMEKTNLGEIMSYIIIEEENPNGEVAHNKNDERLVSKRR